MKKFFVMAMAALVFAACGGGNNKQAQTGAEGEECTIVCVAKVIANPAEFAGKEFSIAGKLAKCDSTGAFYACADSLSIQLIPAEGLAIAEDMVGKVVTITGTVNGDKLNVSNVIAADCQVSDAKESSCCEDKKDEKSCDEDKKEGSNEAKGTAE